MSAATGNYVSVHISLQLDQVRLLAPLGESDLPSTVDWPER